MDSDLYISVRVRHPSTPHINPDYWGKLFDGPSADLARGIVVDAFGSFDDQEAGGEGYLTSDQIRESATHPECPWHEDAYWVRALPGQVFCDIIREKRWRRIQKAPDGTYDFADKECSPELRAFAALVKGLLDEGLDVRVWCWHSQ